MRAAGRRTAPRPAPEAVLPVALARRQRAQLRLNLVRGGSRLGRGGLRVCCGALQVGDAFVGRVDHGLFDPAGVSRQAGKQAGDGC